VDHAKIAKLDRDNEVAPPATVSMELGKVLQKARQDYKDSEGKPKPMSQGDLAKMINAKATIVQECEYGCWCLLVVAEGEMEVGDEGAPREGISRRRGEQCSPCFTTFIASVVASPGSRKPFAGDEAWEARGEGLPVSFYLQERGVWLRSLQ
jgi:hypothetical protein